MENIEKTTTLLMFDTLHNCNKFYKAILKTNGEISCDFGRVGASAQTAHYSGGQKKYDSIIKSKIKKGYREIELEAEIGDTGQVQTRTKHNAIDTALEQIKFLDTASELLVKTVAKSNIHQITSNSNVKYDSATGLFSTALGIIKKEAVERALILLSRAEKLVELSDDNHDNELLQISSDYFMIIPNIVANAREKRNLLFSKDNIKKQREVCNNLLDTLELLQDLKTKTPEVINEKKEQVFDISIGEVTDPNIIRELSDYYQKSKNSMHGYQIMNSKVSKIYSIQIASQMNAFEKCSKEIGNVHRFFHGTKLCNCLSIFSRGLLMPKQSPGSQAGAMFGAGIYFANQSSKSLQYCDGLYWSGNSAKTSKVYMFIASVAVGKEFIPRSSTGANGRPPAGYHSFWAKAGHSGVRNDEIVVFNLDQIRLDYLLEIDL